MFLGKSYKELILEGTKWKILFALIVTTIAEISIFQANIIPIKNRIYVGIFLLFFTYILSHTASLLVHAIKTLIAFLKGVAPETAYTERNKKTVKHNFTWWLNFSLGIVLATVFLDVILISGTILGFIILLPHGSIWLEIRYGLSNLLTNFPKAEGLFVFFLVYVFFVAFFAARLALADHQVRLNEKVTPCFVFQRSIMMLWTFGHGDDVRNLNKKIKIDLWALAALTVIMFLIGWLIDAYANSGYLARIILIGLGIIYTTLNDLYRIK